MRSGALAPSSSLEGHDFDAAKAAARRYAAQHDGLFIEDGNERTVAEGAGTIALEIFDELRRRAIAPELILVPLGNGALLTGVASWVKAQAPGCKVVGVVAAGAPAMKLSWEQGRAVSTPDVATVADGIAVREPVAYALACMKGLVADVIAVNEETLRAAVQFCARHYGLVVEPAGAAGLAGLLGATGFPANQVAVTILCGGNTAL